MKILFDEDVPHKLARFLLRHEVHTVVGMQWGSVKNGELLKLIEKEQFKVFLTGDKNMQNEQKLAGRPFAVLVLSTINWPLMRTHLAAISQALDFAKPGTVCTIECGTFKPYRNT